MLFSILFCVCLGQVFGNVDLTPTDVLTCFLLAQAAQRCKREQAVVNLLRGAMVDHSDIIEDQQSSAKQSKHADQAATFGASAIISCIMFQDHQSSAKQSKHVDQAALFDASAIIPCIMFQDHQSSTQQSKHPDQAALFGASEIPCIPLLSLSFPCKRTMGL